MAVKNAPKEKPEEKEAPQKAESEEKTAPKDQLPKAAYSNNAIVEMYNNMTESTLFRSPYVPDSYKPPFNPDDLWQKAGSYRIYETMQNDDQVSICLQVKKDLIIGEGGDFTIEDEAQEDMKKFLEVSLNDLSQCPLDEYFEEILSSMEFGFSMTEKVFEIMDDGMLTLKSLKTRHPNTWRLHQDDAGNVTKYEQITSKGNIDVNPKSLIHFINNKKFQNPYGKSDLRAAYEAWFAKKECVKYLAIFLEKGASPVPVGRYDKNAPEGLSAKLLEILKKFQTKTAIVLPKEIEVEFLESKNTGEAFLKAIHLFNMFIGRSLFIPDLLGFSGAEVGGGSFALGKEQISVFFMHINRRRKALESVINKQIVWPMIVYNFGFQESYPKFKFKPLDDSKAIELAKTWAEVVKGKIYEASDEEINHFRSLVKFPEGPVDRPEPAPSPFGGGDPNDPNKPGQKIDSEGKPLPPDEGQASDKKVPDSKDKAGKESEPQDKSFGKIYDKPSGDYHKKVDFKAIKTKLDDYDNSIQSESKKIVNKMLSDLFDQIERKNIIKSQNTARIDGLSLKYKKELKQVFKASLTQLFKDAQVQAEEEIFKVKFRRPVTDEKFLEILEDETFKFVGDYEYGVLKRTRTELISAIRDGRPLSSVLDVLDVDLRQLSDTQLERFARTKHTEVLNQGRVSFFNDSGVVQGYQYSAILDDTTSGICAGLDGKKFALGDEPIPPLHFNCRSVLIPITKFEEFEPDEKTKGMNIDDFIEENKGEGFPTK